MTSGTGTSCSVGQQIVGERHRERIALVVIGKFLEQRAAEPLSEAADDLPFHQRGIDRAPDVVGDAIALDLDAAGVAVDADHRDIAAIG